MLTTFGQVLKWIAPHTGKTVEDNRDDLVIEANRIIEHFYLSYEETGILEHPVEECIQVEEFQEFCNDCRDTYFGFVLPPTIQTVEGVKRNDKPMSLYGKWRAYHPDAERSCSVDVVIDEMSRYPFEREFSAGFIKFKAKDKRDWGKKIRIVYTNTNGKQVTEDIVLGNKYHATSQEVLSVAEGGVVLPTLNGGVWVAMADGCIISEYSPFETVPSYRRYKVEGVDCNDYLRVVGTRRNLPLYWDTDVVHLGNQLAFENQARAFRFYNSEDSDPSMAGKATMHEALAHRYLIGEKSRENGKGSINRVNISSGPLRMGRLVGHRRL